MWLLCGAMVLAPAGKVVAQAAAHGVAPPADTTGAPSAAALETFVKAHLAVAAFRGQLQAELAEPKNKKPEIQLQIGVSRSLKKDMTGSFYNGKYPEEAQAKDAAKLIKPNDWNKFKLVAKGDTFTVWINGTQASQYKDAKYAAPGPIGLQIHGGLAMKIDFRNLRIRPLQPDAK